MFGTVSWIFFTMLRLGKLLPVTGVLLLVSLTRTSVIPEVENFNFFYDIDENAFSEALKNPDEDAYLSTVELIDKYGYNSESYTVATYDEYVLEMHRITGPKTDPDPKGKPAILLMHGIVMSSSDWIILGPGKALGYILADAGYDVWMGNVRGNTYSRKHLKSSVTDNDYWQFSWHEIGLRDLPAMIDRILENTGQKKISYIGHSQGTTIFFAMAAEMPEYAEKILSMHALAPVAFCKNMKSPLLKLMSKFSGSITMLTKFFGINELRLTQTFYDKFTSKVCQENSILQPLCSNLLFLITGFSPNQLNMTMLPIILGHVPAGASVRQAIHYSQLMNNDYFRQFDHGFFQNFRKYGTFSPPDYDLRRIKTPVSLHYSVNDWLTHNKDVQKLYSKLGNPIGKFRVPLDEFNHLDFLWGKDADTLLYDKLLSLLSRYKPDEL